VLFIDYLIFHDLNLKIIYSPLYCFKYTCIKFPYAPGFGLRLQVGDPSGFYDPLYSFRSTIWTLQIIFFYFDENAFELTPVKR
jgi:hypothetical protein